MKGKQSGGAQSRNVIHIFTPHFFVIYSSIVRPSSVFLPSSFSDDILCSFTTFRMPGLSRAKVCSENMNGRDRVRWKDNIEIEIKEIGRGLVSSCWR
jgi:hypothetical protein